jgi:UDP-GlcNAc:undecaprenyl-phosphate/decaprenyl-phosphate GlcNAc-1-phosphate transferase
MLHALADHLEVIWGALLAFAIVVLLTPAVGGMARLLGVVDRPEARRLNRSPVPRLGGIALFFGIFVPALAFLDLGRETRGLLLGAAVATTVGAVDDFRGLRWWEKLAGQTAAAAIPVGFGVWVHRFTFPVLGIHVLPDWVGMPLSVLWIVAVMNMVNFLDGLDGLAAGVSAISAFTFTLIALSLPRPEIAAAILSAIVLGAALGFLRHNFYPARIFMGDSGALLLGFVLAAIPLQGLLKTASIVTLFFPLLVLAVPIIDTSFVLLRRLKHGESPFTADQTHLHYRFLRRGFTQRRAALTIWAWCGTLAAAALTVRFVRPHQHGEWHAWRTLITAAVGLVALAASFYIVYILEIVKLSSLRTRRREPQPAERARRSA